MEEYNREYREYNGPTRPTYPTMPTPVHEYRPFESRAKPYHNIESVPHEYKLKVPYEHEAKGLYFDKPYEASPRFGDQRYLYANNYEEIPRKVVVVPRPVQPPSYVPPPIYGVRGY
jgi:hypothetical protein